MTKQEILNKHEIAIMIVTLLLISIVVVALYFIIIPSDLEQANKILNQYDDEVISMRVVGLDEPRYIMFDAQEFIVIGNKGEYRLARNILSHFYPLNRLFEATPGVTPHFGGGQGLP